MVSMEDAVNLSTRMMRLSPLSWCLCVVEHCHTVRGHYRLENKWWTLNWTISITSQYLKPFNCTQTVSCNTWNYLTVFKQISSGSFKNCHRHFGQVGRVLANGPGDLCSFVIPKTLKIVLDTSLLNTQQYKVRIKGKVEQSRERSSTLLYSSV